jgi:hypothetical protein
MAATWDHPKLGRFDYGDYGGWTRMVDVPAFKVFSYDTGYANAPRSTGRHKLVFSASGPSDLPSPPAAATAERVLANQASLVGVVTQALWDDFNGGGPGSGACGDLDAVAKAMKSRKLAVPTAADDLRPALRPAAIIVREFPGYEAPMAELMFDAAFEEEHGVSVLTDGESVLGIGFNLDVLPFGFKPPQRPPFGRSR